MNWPKCGLYRTTVSIGSIEAGRLVFFHNHGEPGPGIYLAQEWHTNRAVFAQKGTVLEEPSLAATLEPLAPEGLYRVAEDFFCCRKKCRTYDPGLLVQLGYNAAGQPILFVPQWTKDGLVFPSHGNRVDEGELAKLAALKVERAPHEQSEPLH